MPHFVINYEQNIQTVSQQFYQYQQSTLNLPRISELLELLDAYKLYKKKHGTTLLTKFIMVLVHVPYNQKWRKTWNNIIDKIYHGFDTCILSPKMKENMEQYYWQNL